MAKAEAQVRDEIPEGLSRKDCFEKGEFQEWVEYHSDMMLRVAWPRLRRFALKHHGLFDWPHPDVLNPGDYE